ncbi:MAG: hypothetical protein U0514_03165 [Candidatus Andersenbacteria bacterium]
MKNLRLLLIALLLLLLVGIEWAYILFWPSVRPSPPASTNQTNQTNQANNVTPPANTTPPTTSLNGTRVFQVTSSSESYKQTQLVTATPSATGRSISIDASDDRSATNRTQGRVQIDPSGSYSITFYSASENGSTFECEGNLPVYLAVGTDTAPVSLSCSFNGTAVGSVTGTATAGAATDYVFNGKTYKARTTTVRASISAGPAATQADTVTYIAAPGIGSLETHGSLGQLIVGQITAQANITSSDKLLEADNDTLFLPK